MAENAAVRHRVAVQKYSTGEDRNAGLPRVDEAQILVALPCPQHHVGQTPHPGRARRPRICRPDARSSRERRYRYQPGYNASRNRISLCLS